MNTSEIAERTTSIHHAQRFSKPGTPIYNFEVQEKMDRKIKAIAKRYALQTNAINHLHERFLRVVDNEYASTFVDLHKLDNTAFIQH